MILVRNIFQCKYGKAGELARLMAEMRGQMEPAEGGGMRVLTDLSGPFDTVVLETVIESIDAYNRQLQEQFADPAAGEVFAQMPALIESGRREYFTIETEG